MKSLYLFILFITSIFVLNTLQAFASVNNPSVLGIQYAYNEITGTDYSQFLKKRLSEYSDLSFDSICITSHYSKITNGICLQINISRKGTDIKIFKNGKLYDKISNENKYSILDKAVITDYFQGKIDEAKNLPNRYDSTFYNIFYRFNNLNSKKYPYEVSKWIAEMKKSGNISYEFSLSDMNKLIQNVFDKFSLTPIRSKTESDLLFLQKGKARLRFYPDQPASNAILINNKILGNTSKIEGNVNLLSDFLYENENIFFVDYDRISKDILKNSYNDSEYDLFISGDTITKNKNYSSWLTKSSEAGVYSKDNGHSYKTWIYLPLSKTIMNLSVGDQSLLNLHIYGYNVSPSSKENGEKLINAPAFPEDFRDYLMYNVANPTYNRIGTALNYILSGYDYEIHKNYDQAISAYNSAWRKLQHVESSSYSIQIFQRYVIVRLIECYKAMGFESYAAWLTYAQNIIDISLSTRIMYYTRFDYQKNLDMIKASQFKVTDEIIDNRLAKAFAVVTFTTNMALGAMYTIDGSKAGDIMAKSYGSRAGTRLVQATNLGSDLRKALSKLGDVSKDDDIKELESDHVMASEKQKLAFVISTLSKALVQSPNESPILKNKAATILNHCGQRFELGALISAKDDWYNNSIVFDEVSKFEDYLYNKTIRGYK